MVYNFFKSLQSWQKVIGFSATLSAVSRQQLIQLPGSAIFTIKNLRTGTLRNNKIEQLC